LTVTSSPSLNGAAGETKINALLGGGAGPVVKVTGSMFPVPSFAKTLSGSTTAIEQPWGVRGAIDLIIPPNCDDSLDGIFHIGGSFDIADGVELCRCRTYILSSRERVRYARAHQDQDVLGRL
jgi:hypothetical protein